MELRMDSAARDREYSTLSSGGPSNGRRYGEGDRGRTSVSFGESGGGATGGAVSLEWHVEKCLPNS